MKDLRERHYKKNTKRVEPVRPKKGHGAETASPSSKVTPKKVAPLKPSRTEHSLPRISEPKRAAPPTTTGRKPPPPPNGRANLQEWSHRPATLTDFPPEWVPPKPAPMRVDPSRHRQIRPISDEPSEAYDSIAFFGFLAAFAGGGLVFGGLFGVFFFAVLGIIFDTTDRRLLDVVLTTILELFESPSRHAFGFFVGSAIGSVLGARFVTKNWNQLDTR